MRAKYILAYLTLICVLSFGRLVQGKNEPCSNSEGNKGCPKKNCPSKTTKCEGTGDKSFCKCIDNNISGTRVGGCPKSKDANCKTEVPFEGAIIEGYDCPIGGGKTACYKWLHYT